MIINNFILITVKVRKEAVQLLGVQWGQNHLSMHNHFSDCGTVTKYNAGKRRVKANS